MKVEFSDGTTKRLTRAQLRGERLEKDCYRAKTTTHEYGVNDNRVFCYGLVDLEFESLPHIPMCENCAALVWNSEPMEGDTDE